MRYAAAAFVSRLRVSHNWGMSGVLHFYWFLFDYYFPSVKFRFVFFYSSRYENNAVWR